VATLDAWTRDDLAANAWHRACGLTENFRCVHVYKDHDGSDEGFETPDGLSKPVTAFMHASIEREAEFRARFRRVHLCRQYLRRL
jgi:hypothetical protein